MAEEADSSRSWHRLFGVILTDFFTGCPFEVEVEKDLSLKKQLLDIVIVRKGPGECPRPLPDGLTELAAHNLITFKSFQEPLDAWALKELLGHYVNYRKQVSPSPKQLLSEEEFHLFAVCARYPRDLAAQVPLEEVNAGVYRCRWAVDVVRVVVLHQLPLSAHNAFLHLFSALPEQVRYGVSHFRPVSGETSTLLGQLLDRYEGEGVEMGYTAKDFRRDFVNELSPEERLKGLSPEERLKGLPAEERLKGLPAEERLKGLSPEERLKGLTPEEIRQLMERLRADSSPPPA